jgi:valyl-tRNA synthetase
VPLEGVIDLNVERQRLQKEIDRLSGMSESIRNKLTNESFIGRAPKDVVGREREKLAAFELNLEKLRNNLSQLQT